MDRQEHLHLQQELRAFVFPDCGLHHEQILEEVDRKTFPLMVINSTHLYPLCPHALKLQRPACPHFNDARSGRDPYERACILLTQEGRENMWDTLNEYRDTRSVLGGIDHAIRKTRQHAHNMRTGLKRDEGRLCFDLRTEWLRDTHQHPPEVLAGIQSLGDMEEALLQLHAQVRERLERLRDRLIEVLE